MLIIVVSLLRLTEVSVTAEVFNGCCVHRKVFIYRSGPGSSIPYLNFSYCRYEKQFSEVELAIRVHFPTTLDFS